MQILNKLKLRIIFIFILFSLLVSCNDIDDTTKQICASDPKVRTAKTDQAAKYAYEACVEMYKD